MRVERAAVSFQPYTARTPIKYGAVEMSEVTFCLAEVEVVSPEGHIGDWTWRYLPSRPVGVS